MEHEPDYARCALHELEDVARRINRERFPERYARVVAEIEQRQSDPNFSTPAARSSIRALIWFVVVEYGMLALLGIVGPIAVYNAPSSPPTDMPMGLLLVPITLAFFAVAGCCFALMRWALRSVEDRELVQFQSLKALAWAPLALLLLMPTTTTVRVALAFVLPFEMIIQLMLLLVIPLVAMPFVALFWQIKHPR